MLRKCENPSKNLTSITNWTAHRWGKLEGPFLQFVLLFNNPFSINSRLIRCSSIFLELKWFISSPFSFHNTFIWVQDQIIKCSQSKGICCVRWRTPKKYSQQQTDKKILFYTQTLIINLLLNPGGSTTAFSLSTPWIPFSPFVCLLFPSSFSYSRGDQNHPKGSHFHQDH